MYIHFEMNPANNPEENKQFPRAAFIPYPMAFGNNPYILHQFDALKMLSVIILK